MPRAQLLLLVPLAVLSPFALWLVERSEAPSQPSAVRRAPVVELPAQPAASGAPRAAVDESPDEQAFPAGSPAATPEDRLREAAAGGDVAGALRIQLERGAGGDDPAARELWELAAAALAAGPTSDE